jgi:hypothetical protein
VSFIASDATPSDQIGSLSLHGSAASALTTSPSTRRQGAPVPGTLAPLTTPVLDTRSVNCPGSSVSDTGLRAFHVPGTSAPSVVDVPDTQSVTSQGPSVADTGSRAATVPGTLLPSASVGPVTWCDSFSGTGKVWYGRRGPIGHLYASFDGVFRPLSDRCAYAWCVWSSDHRLIDWQATTFLDSHSNNVMEAEGLLACLRWIQAELPFHRVDIYGDSRVVISQALCQFACRAPHLARVIGAVRALGSTCSLFSLHAILRASNTAADGLCNWIMDSFPAADLTLSGTRWSCLQPYALAQSPPLLLGLVPSIAPNLPDLLAHVAAAWSLVLDDFHRVAHLVQARFASPSSDQPRHPPVLGPAPPPRVFTVAASLISWFDTPSTR